MLPAVADWKVLDGGLCVFYGNGGEFTASMFERWYGDICGGVTKYVGGTGSDFSIPSAVRDRGRPVFLERRIPFATVTDNYLVRGFVTTGAWFGLRIAAFSWADAAGAMSWLDLSPSVAEKALATLFELRLSVNGKLQRRMSLGTAAQ